MLAYIDGTAWSVDAVLTSCFSQSENSLLILLIAAARHAYRHGVRDAHVGALSTETQRVISQQLITADAKKTAMRSFHDELSEL